MDTLGLFMKEIGRYPLLSKDEERELLWVVFNNQNLPRPLENEPDPYAIRRILWKDARDKLACHNLRLVIYQARKYMGRGVEIEDLVAYGYDGLLHAIDKFDPSKYESRLTTYATWWIIQAVKVGINLGTTIHIPSYLWDAMAKWHAVSNKLASRLGGLPTDEQIRLELGLDPSDVEKIKQAFRSRASISYSASDETDNPVFSEAFIAGPEAPSPQDTMEQDADYAAVMKDMGKLPARMQLILELRYGLNGRRPHSLEECGHELGITKERIRQIQVRAEAFLKCQRLRDLRQPVPDQLEVMAAAV